MPIYLCTYFDSNYADKGWVCAHTIRQQNKDAIFFILGLDDEVYRIANTLPNTIGIKLSDLEKRFPELLVSKGNRLLKEYFATLSPILPLYIFEKFPYVDLLFYTDADIAFWSDPAEMKDVVGNKSLMVVDHGFEPPRSNVRFNVGILAYRNDEYCKEFLEWWKERCLEWCKWVTLPNGMCADQGYLNIIHDEPNRFKKTLSCPHPGINLGPWNLAMHVVSEKNGKPIVDGQYNLICYHYHEFRMLGSSTYYPTGWKYTENDKKIIYEPYFTLMQKFQNNLL